ncbi:MAG: hypothetical protein KC619_11705 [Myxococcales bacterium]|nr:hypothetical protein [Myxococcales bacterium]
MRRRSILWAAAALSLLGAASSAVGDPPPRPSVHYTVSIDAAIEHLDARVCFDGRPPRRLGPGVDAAARALITATDDEGRPLRFEDGRIDLSGLGDDACMRYRLDLPAAARASRFAGHLGGEMVSSQGAWLWRDRAAVPRGGGTIRFETPPNVVVTTPWRVRRDGSQHLGTAAFRRPGFVAFGHRAPRVVERRGVRARLVRLGEGWTIGDDALEAWLGEAIDGIAAVQGRFPVDDLVVILVPTVGSGMGFGMVRRGGGYSAIYMVGRESTPEALRESWVTWHELSHLQLPALPQRDAWLYEGLATYYQEVIPARLGIQSREAAWGELVDGFARGARSRGTGDLGEDATSMMRTGGFQRVYWAGTAFALEADVTLRQRGSSLDDAIRRAAPRWRNDFDVWTSDRVCAAWDAPLDASVLRPLRDRFVTQRGFPATAALLRRLGVHERDGHVSLVPAELGPTRDGIMAARPSSP